MPADNLLFPLSPDLLVSFDKSLRLIDLSVGLFLLKEDLVVAESVESRLKTSRSPEEATDSREDDLDLTVSRPAGTFKPAGFCKPVPEVGRARLLEGRGRVLVFLGATRPEEESLEVALRRPLLGLLTEVLLGLALGPGIPPSLLFWRDRVSFVCLGLFLFLFRGKVP